MVQIINILPDGVESKPLFKTEEDYQKWRQEFIDAVSGDMKKWLLACKRSELESMFRIVD
jgi:hypothetical protein